MGPVRHGDGTGAIRTFERGVEGETLACGSGSIASAFVLREAGLGDRHLTLRVMGGDDLTIEILDPRPPDGDVRRVRLTGPAVSLFDGSFPDTVFSA